jgi:hypothetical protein
MYSSCTLAFWLHIVVLNVLAVLLTDTQSVHLYRSMLMIQTCINVTVLKSTRYLFIILFSISSRNLYLVVCFSNLDHLLLRFFLLQCTVIYDRYCDHHVLIVGLSAVKVLCLHDSYHLCKIEECEFVVTSVWRDTSDLIKILPAVFILNLVSDQTDGQTDMTVPLCILVCHIQKIW